MIAIKISTSQERKRLFCKNKKTFSSSHNSPSPFFGGIFENSRHKLRRKRKTQTLLKTLLKTLFLHCSSFKIETSNFAAYLNSPVPLVSNIHHLENNCTYFFRRDTFKNFLFSNVISKWNKLNNVFANTSQSPF